MNGSYPLDYFISGTDSCKGDSGGGLYTWRDGVPTLMGVVSRYVPTLRLEGWCTYTHGRSIKVCTRLYLLYTWRDGVPTLMGVVSRYVPTLHLEGWCTYTHGRSIKVCTYSTPGGMVYLLYTHGSSIKVCAYSTPGGMVYLH